MASFLRWGFEDIKKGKFYVEVRNFFSGKYFA
jgi:hypothetical protein